MCCRVEGIPGPPRAGPIATVNHRPADVSWRPGPTLVGRCNRWVGFLCRCSREGDAQAFSALDPAVRRGPFLCGPVRQALVCAARSRWSPTGSSRPGLLPGCPCSTGDDVGRWAHLQPARSTHCRRGSYASEAGVNSYAPHVGASQSIELLLTDTELLPSGAIALIRTTGSTRLSRSPGLGSRDARP